jgi:hypothetical protein
MTQAERLALLGGPERCRKASRNPRPDQHDLAAELEAIGLDFLDQQSERIQRQLDDGQKVYDVARTFYRVVITHMLAWRRADNAAYWAAAKAAA